MGYIANKWGGGGINLKKKKKSFTHIPINFVPMVVTINFFIFLKYTTFLFGT